MSVLLRKLKYVFNKQGIVGVVVSSLRYMLYNIRLSIMYIKHRLYVSGTRSIVGQVPNPFRIIDINPSGVKRVSHTSSDDRFILAGDISGGDWDENTNLFCDTALYETFVDRYIYQKSWDNIAFIQECCKKVDGDEVVWGGCATREDISEKCKSIDRLYNSIKNEGYKSQTDLSTLSLFPIKDEVSVDIDRNGEFLFVDGHHRLALAKVIGVDKVPCRVVRRHEDWQKLREEVLQSDNVDDLSRKAKENIDHPDIQYLVSK